MEIELKKFQDYTSRQFMYLSNCSIYHFLSSQYTRMHLLLLKLFLLPIRPMVFFYFITPGTKIPPIHSDYSNATSPISISSNNRNRRTFPLFFYLPITLCIVCVLTVLSNSKASSLSRSSMLCIFLSNPFCINFRHTSPQRGLKEFSIQNFLIRA